MNTKRIISLVASLALVLSLSVGLTGCGDKAAQDDNQGSTDGEGTKYTVGICQLVQHDALDAATNGFMDALNEALPGQVTFDLKNASNDIPTCGTIVTGFVASNVDLILANATPALQAASTATQTIPILGTAVTEYGVALDIKDFNGTVGGNISGTSDLAPLDQQADMLLELLPDAKNVGILYCSAEANSVYQADVVKAALEAKGWRLCRFLRRTELRASFTVETAQGTKIYEPVDCLWELTFPDGPIRHADGGWYDPASNAIETLRFVYGADGTTAFFEVMDDGQDKQFVFSADGREPAETMDFLRVEPVDA